MSTFGTQRLTERGVLASMLYKMQQALNNRWFAPLFTFIESNQVDGENHSWLGGVPQMAERTGNPVFDELRVNDYYIANKDYEANLKIPKKDWDHNRASLIQQRIGQMAVAATAHPGTLLQTLLTAAEATACYDAQFYFDDDHSEGDSGTQSNDLTFEVADADASLPTVDEMAKAILKAVVAMWGYKDDKGNEMNLDAKKFVVAAGPTIYPYVLEAVRAKLLSSGGTNIVAENRDFELVPQILPSVTGDKFYTFRADAESAPFILQTLDDAAPESLGRDSEFCKINNHLLFKMTGSYGAGYGLWQHAALTTLET